MQRAGDKQLDRTIEAARELMTLAEDGVASCRDSGCAVVFGVVRDCAYRIRGEAEREKQFHREVAEGARVKRRKEEGGNE